MKLLDGKALATELRADVTVRTRAFIERVGRAPGLVVVLVGEDPASQIYTRNKEKAAKECGFNGELHRLSHDATEEEVLACVSELNARLDVDGILVQLPLPKHLNETRILDAVSPAKDVDGFHPMNAGLLASGRPALVPCTPSGCMRLLHAAGISIAGKHAVVVGRSNIVGKPMAQLLLAAHATVTIAHSRTTDLAAVCKTADILVAAVGKAELIRASWIKPGAVVLDVGINRVPPAPGAPSDDKGRLVGDVAFDECAPIASAITPVPGGVGPMTIACLLDNTLLAGLARHAAATSA